MLVMVLHPVSLEPLNGIYTLLSVTVQELLPPKLLVNGVSPLQPPSSSHTPMTPAFPQQPQPQSIPLDALSKWADTAAMVVSSPMTSDTSSALSALGDQLVANGWYEAAHAWYVH